MMLKKLSFLFLFVIPNSAQAQLSLSDFDPQILNQESTLEAKKATEKGKTPPSEDSVYVVESALSSVTLRMGHNLFGRFDTIGKGGLKGQILLKGDSLLVAPKLEFAPNSFESLIGLRDEHIKKEYLEISKYPVIQLLDARSSLLSLKQIKSDMQKNFEGRLVVKNVSVNVNGKAQAYIKDQILRARVDFSGKLSDFPIKEPKYKGVGVDDTFHIIVDLVARPDLGDDDSIDL